MADEERSRREVRILPAVDRRRSRASRSRSASSPTRPATTASRRRRVTIQAAGGPGDGDVRRRCRPQVAAGAHTFVQFACVQCHGFQGRGGVDPAVPALTTVGQSLTVAQLTHIINHGLGASADPKQPYMPVWGEVISKTQVSDLVAYIRAGLPAVADTSPVSVPAGQGAAVAGAALYVRYGCINCHGPNGLGGVPNPLSPDKTIPPLSGAGLPRRVPDRQGDRGRDPQRQRDRQGADREHAALGRDPLRPADRRAERVPEDAEVTSE